MSAESKVTSAITSLVLDHPFFGSLALGLKRVPDETCKTAWVDGRTIGYNPTFVDSLNHDLILGIMAHEVMHPALGHNFRRGDRDPKTWNQATDLSINPQLRDSGFKLPDGVLFPAQFGLDEGKSAEWYYSHLQAKQSQGDDPSGNGDGDGQGDSDGQGDPLGECRDAPNDIDADGDGPPTEQEWKQKAAQAAQTAKAMGKLPGGLARAIQDALKPQIDIRSLLLRFFSERSTGDYSWTRPNSRYIAQGLYLPALESKALGEIAIGIDTSGSVDSISLNYARGIVESVIEECSPAAVTVHYFDSTVQRVDRFERGESLTWEPMGGGGTSFVEVLEAIELEGTAVCAVVITDLQGTFPDSCSLPVLWLATEEGTAPFGETVPLDR